jgi:TetR/AcrR family transcriptional repressor of cmeABC operon
MATPAATRRNAGVRPPAAGTRGEQLESRCQKFVDIAEQLFLERGFAGTSVNEVVKLSGGSLATLYSQYGNKEELFEAVMRRRAAALFIDIVTRIEKRRPQLPDVRDELLSLATTIHSQMLSAGSLALFRLAVHEGPKFPRVRQALLASGLDVFLKRLADYFAGLASERLQIEDPVLAAEEFVSLIQGQQRLIAACGDTARLTRQVREKHVKRAVAVFLCVYPPQVAGSPARRVSRK